MLSEQASIKQYPNGYWGHTGYGRPGVLVSDLSGRTLLQKLSVIDHYGMTNHSFDMSVMPEIPCYAAATDSHSNSRYQQLHGLDEIRSDVHIPDQEPGHEGKHEGKKLFHLYDVWSYIYDSADALCCDGEKYLIEDIDLFISCRKAPCLMTICF